MNALVDMFPTSIEIDGREYEINSDFKTCLKIILAFEDNELTAFEKNSVMLELLYKEIPPNYEKACEMAIKFLDCGEEKQEQTSSGRMYSFDQDAKYIFSAIQYSHGIELSKCPDLHWWAFNYLFLDLKEDCFFNRLLYLRRQKKLGKMSKEEREAYYSIQSIVDLPELKTQDEQMAENEFMRLLREGEANGA